jgi:hypothetical protein
MKGVKYNNFNSLDANFCWGQQFDAEKCDSDAVGLENTVGHRESRVRQPVII